MDPERIIEFNHLENDHLKCKMVKEGEDKHEEFFENILDEKIQSLENEHKWVKETLVSLITHVQRLKDEKVRLSVQLRETDYKLDSANKRIEELDETIRKIQANQSLEVGKLEGALSHQAKIIKFIRRTVKNLRNKKVLWGRMFGRNDSVSEIFSSPPLLNLDRTRRQSADYSSLALHPSNLPSPYSSPRSLSPQETMKTFQRRERDVDTISLSLIVEEERRQMEGWVKILSETSRKWRKVYAVLKNSILHFYENDCENCPEDFNICLLNGNAILHNAVSSMEAGLMSSTVKSDLPFILKLEVIPANIRQPGRLYYIMVPNLVMKQLWKRVLETITEQPQLLGSLALRLDKNNILDIYCAHQYNDELLLLGAEEGLFMVNLNNEAELPAQIHGPFYVFQIAILVSLNCILMIADNHQILYQVDLMAMDIAMTSGSRSLPPSAMLPVEDINLCHLFEFTQSLDATYLCIATSDKICILKWYYRTNSFILQKELLTSVPCSSILFTKKFIIVGVERFVTIGLKDFTTSDFIDYGDHLHLMTKETDEEGKFPLAVLLVSTGGQSEEFLLCFQKFGIFVDIEGQRTRKRILEWTGMPLAFSFRHPYLFVVHINSLIITEIPATKNERIIKHVFMDANSPRLLGPSPTEGTIFFTSLHKYCLLVLNLSGNLITEVLRNFNSIQILPEDRNNQESQNLNLLDSTYVSLLHQSIEFSSINCSPISNFGENVID